MDKSRPRRSSILKAPRASPVQNETIADPKPLKVRFSTNFIKGFATTDDKNQTIWDSTYEEDIENSTTSQAQATASSSGSVKEPSTQPCWEQQENIPLFARRREDQHPLAPKNMPNEILFDESGTNNSGELHCVQSGNVPQFKIYTDDCEEPAAAEDSVFNVSMFPSPNCCSTRVFGAEKLKAISQQFIQNAEVKPTISLHSTAVRETDMEMTRCIPNAVFAVVDNAPESNTPSGKTQSMDMSITPCVRSRPMQETRFFASNADIEEETDLVGAENYYRVKRATRLDLPTEETEMFSNDVLDRANSRKTQIFIPNSTEANMDETAIVGETDMKITRCIPNVAFVVADSAPESCTPTSEKTQSMDMEMTQCLGNRPMQETRFFASNADIEEETDLVGAENYHRVQHATMFDLPMEQTEVFSNDVLDRANSRKTQIFIPNSTKANMDETAIVGETDMKITRCIPNVAFVVADNARESCTPTSEKTQSMDMEMTQCLGNRPMQETRFLASNADIEEETDLVSAENYHRVQHATMFDLPMEQTEVFSTDVVSANSRKTQIFIPNSTEANMDETDVLDRANGRKTQLFIPNSTDETAVVPGIKLDSNKTQFFNATINSMDITKGCAVKQIQKQNDSVQYTQIFGSTKNGEMDITQGLASEVQVLITDVDKASTKTNIDLCTNAKEHTVRAETSAATEEIGAKFNSNRSPVLNATMNIDSMDVTKGCGVIHVEPVETKNNSVQYTQIFGSTKNGEIDITQGYKGDKESAKTNIDLSNATNSKTRFLNATSQNDVTHGISNINPENSNFKSAIGNASNSILTNKTRLFTATSEEDAMDITRGACSNTGIAECVNRTQNQNTNALKFSGIIVNPRENVPAQRATLNLNVNTEIPQMPFQIHDTEATRFEVEDMSIDEATETRLSNQLQDLDITKPDMEEMRMPPTELPLEINNIFGIEEQSAGPCVGSNDEPPSAGCENLNIHKSRRYSQPMDLTIKKCVLTHESSTLKQKMSHAEEMRIRRTTQYARMPSISSSPDKVSPVTAVPTTMVTSMLTEQSDIHQGKSTISDRQASESVMVPADQSNTIDLTTEKIGVPNLAIEPNLADMPDFFDSSDDDEGKLSQVTTANTTRRQSMRVYSIHENVTTPNESSKRGRGLHSGKKKSNERDLSPSFVLMKDANTPETLKNNDFKKKKEIPILENKNGTPQYNTKAKEINKSRNVAIPSNKSAKDQEGSYSGKKKSNPLRKERDCSPSFIPVKDANTPETLKNDYKDKKEIPIMGNKKGISQCNTKPKKIKILSSIVVPTKSTKGDEGSHSRKKESTPLRKGQDCSPSFIPFKDTNPPEMLKNKEFKKNMELPIIRIRDGTPQFSKHSKELSKLRNVATAPNKSARRDRDVSPSFPCPPMLFEQTDETVAPGNMIDSIPTKEVSSHTAQRHTGAIPKRGRSQRAISPASAETEVRTPIRDDKTMMKRKLVSSPYSTEKNFPQKRSTNVEPPVSSVQHATGTKRTQDTTPCSGEKIHGKRVDNKSTPKIVHQSSLPPPSIATMSLFADLRENPRSSPLHHQERSHPHMHLNATDLSETGVNLMNDSEITLYDDSVTTETLSVPRRAALPKISKFDFSEFEADEVVPLENTIVWTDDMRKQKKHLADIMKDHFQKTAKQIQLLKEETANNQQLAASWQRGAPIPRTQIYIEPVMQIKAKVRNHREYRIGKLAVDSVTLCIPLAHCDVMIKFDKTTTIVSEIDIAKEAEVDPEALRLLKERWEKDPVGQYVLFLDDTTANREYANKFTQHKLQVNVLKSCIGDTFSVLSLMDYLEYQFSEFTQTMIAIRKIPLIYFAKLDNAQRLTYTYHTRAIYVEVELDLSEFNLHSARQKTTVFRGPVIASRIDEILQRTPRDPPFPLHFLQAVDEYLKSVGPCSY